MTKVTLDPKKLLGFRIEAVANGKVNTGLKLGDKAGDKIGSKDGVKSKA